MLEVNRINVYYGDLQVLWDISLKVDEGEIVALCGSNGAGKSTLLKTISGLLSPRSGSIRFFGERIDGHQPYEIVRKGISLVPEGRRIFPYMTVVDNLKLGAHTQKDERGKEESLKLVYEIFPVLKERKNQLAGTLSGGEQQMLAIGRALMSHPKLLLLDEPSIGLAPIIRERIFEVIREVRKRGITILLAEQNVYQTLKLADRAYVLENGRVVLTGTGEEVLQNENVKKAYLGI